MSKKLHDLLHPLIPENLKRVKMTFINTDSESLCFYGFLFESSDTVNIEIARWPAQGWRNVDEVTGDEGGTKEGMFECEWRGDIFVCKKRGCI